MIKKLIFENFKYFQEEKMIKDLLYNISKYYLILYNKFLSYIDTIFIFILPYCSDILFQICFNLLFFIQYLQKLIFKNLVYNSQKSRNFEYFEDNYISHDSKILYANIINHQTTYNILYSFKIYLMMNKQYSETFFSLNKFKLIYNSIIKSKKCILHICYKYNDNIKYKSIELDNKLKQDNIIKL